jgi:hypothetical protein
VPDLNKRVVVDGEVFLSVTVVELKRTETRLYLESADPLEPELARLEETVVRRREGVAFG